MEKVPQEVLNCLEANERYLEKKLECLDNLLDEIDSRESGLLEYDEVKLKSLKEEYEREIKEIQNHKELYELLVQQTKDFISK
jgi:hypothetical protein